MRWIEHQIQQHISLGENQTTVILMQLTKKLNV